MRQVEKLILGSLLATTSVGALSAEAQNRDFSFGKETRAARPTQSAKLP